MTKSAEIACLSCPSPREPGRTRCRPCLDAINAQVQASQFARKSAGLCVRCANPAEGATLCPRCRDLSNGKRRARQAGKKSAGLCAECPRPALPGRTRCAAHRGTHRPARPITPDQPRS